MDLLTTAVTDAHCLQAEESRAAKQAEASAAAAAAGEAVARSPARPATPLPKAPPALPAAAAALSPASSVDMVDMRYSLDDDVDDQQEELEPEAPDEAPPTSVPAAQPPAEATTAAPRGNVIETAEHRHSPPIDVVTWLQSLGLLLNQCPWEAAAKAAGSAARQSLLQPLLGLLRQLVTAASMKLPVDAIVSTVVQVLDYQTCSLRLMWLHHAMRTTPWLFSPDSCP